MVHKSYQRDEFGLWRPAYRRQVWHPLRSAIMNTDELASSLRCTELLNDSPSTSRVTIRGDQRGRRSQRIVLQPIGNTASRRYNGIDQWHNYEVPRPALRKRSSMEARLNTPQFPAVASLFDRQIGTDPRVLDSFKLTEVSNAVNSHYFNSIQDHMQPSHREQAIDWLHDVALEERCEIDIFPLAVSIFDRFLSYQSILKEHIQTLASVCLFLASKLKAPRPLNAQRMSYYTADSVPSSEILNWEILVLSTLGWDINTPTAFDFFDQMAARMPSLLYVKQSFSNVIHKMQANSKLGMLIPSVQCALGLLFACDSCHNPAGFDLEALLPQTLGIDMMMLRGQMPQVIRLMEGRIVEAQSPAAPPTSCRTPSPNLASVKPPVPETPMNDSGFCSGVSSPESIGRVMDCSPPKLSRLDVA